MKVPLLDLFVQNDPLLPEIRKAIEEVFKTHYYILGPHVAKLEEEVAAYSGTKYAIGCASGTDALILALQALNIGEGDEVITTPFTFFASTSSITRLGAKSVFVDIKEDTFNLDPEKIEAAITPKTKAILPVHLFGQMAEMDKIMAIAEKHQLAVVEDAAQSIGSEYDGKKAGQYGDVGTLSFFPSKNLGAMGDGGMCLTNNENLAASLKQLRVHGESPKYYHKWVGLNSRLDSLQAAILSVKLKQLANWSEMRRKNADYYFEHLKDVPQIQLPAIHPKAKSIFNQFTLRAEKRDALLDYLRKNDIGCAVYYPLPLHVQECFAYLNHQKGDFPVSEKAAEQVISIPIYSELAEEQLAFVAETIRKFYQ